MAALSGLILQIVTYFHVDSHAKPQESEDVYANEDRQKRA